MAGKAQQPGNVVTDLYLSWPDAPADGDQVSTALHGALVHQPALAGGRRITVTVCSIGEQPGAAVHLPALRRAGWPRSGSSAACTR